MRVFFFFDMSFLILVHCYGFFFFFTKGGGFELVTTTALLCIISTD
jgi:hypothetical protein